MFILIFICYCFITDNFWRGCPGLYSSSAQQVQVEEVLQEASPHGLPAGADGAGRRCPGEPCALSSTFHPYGAGHALSAGAVRVTTGRS